MSVPPIKLLLIRHRNAELLEGDTQTDQTPPSLRRRKPHLWDEADKHRALTVDGVKQCDDAKQGWFQQIKPTEFILSPSMRCAATAGHIIGVGQDSLESASTLPLLHPTGFLEQANEKETAAMQTCFRLFACLFRVG